MKNFLKLCSVVLLFGTMGFAQKSTNLTTCPQKFDVTTAVSGVALTIPNDCGALHASFDEEITGSPATISVVIKGCMRGSLAPCTTLDTSTSTSSVIRKPTIDTIYDYYTVTPTWTGGTAPAVTIKSTQTVANGGSLSGGTGNVTGPAGATAGDLAVYADNTGLLLSDPGPNVTIPGDLFLHSINPSSGNKTWLFVDGVTYANARAAIAACPTIGCIVWDLNGTENLTAGSTQPFCTGTWSPLAPDTCTSGTWKRALLYLGFGTYTTDYMIQLGNPYEQIIGQQVSVGRGLQATGTIISASATWDQTGPDAEHPMVRMSARFTGSNYQFSNVVANLTLDCTAAATAGKVCSNIINDGSDEHSKAADIRLLGMKPPTATSATTGLTRTGCPGACSVAVTTAAITGCTTGCVLENGQQLVIAGTTSAGDSFNGTFTVASHTEVGGITTSFTYNQTGPTNNESATGQGTIRIAGAWVGWYGNGAQNSSLENLELGCGGFQDANSNGVVVASYSIRRLDGLTAVCGTGTIPNAAVLVTGSSTDPDIFNPHVEGFTHGISFVNGAGGTTNNISIGNTSAGDALCICDASVKAVNVFDTNINVSGTLSLITDTTFSPTYTAPANVAHMGYYLIGLIAGTTQHTYWSDLKNFADPQQAIAFEEQTTPTIQAITAVNQGAIWNDSTAHRFKFCFGNGNCPTTDSIVGANTVDVFTNKTYDTSATGNVFKFHQANAQTTTYPVVAADFASCKTIPVASGTFTVTLVVNTSQPASGQCIYVVNYGTGVVTIARNGQNINGAAANYTINAGSATLPQAAFIWSDGTNYFAITAGGNVTTAGTTCPVGNVVVGNSGTLNTIQCLSQITSNGSLINKYNNLATAGNGLSSVNAVTGAVTIGSGTSIGATSLCSTTQCPAGRYRVDIYIDITTACTTTGTYIPWLAWTDDAGAKTGSSTTTYFASAGGLGVTPATASAGATLGLASTSNFLTGTAFITTTGAATGGLGSINYGTTATACGTGGPMVGKMYLDVTRLE